MAVRIREAGLADVDLVAGLVHALLSELRPPEVAPPKLDSILATTARLLGRDRGVWAFVAEQGTNEAVGVITLYEGVAIYAGGTFGTIAELYVRPGIRSAGVGPELLNAAMTFGRERGWGRLEVGAPAVPRWARTVSFYIGNGFEEVGPRLKYIL